MRPRPVLHEIVTEIETDYYETETETETKMWSRDYVGLETFTSLLLMHIIIIFVTPIQADNKKYL